MTITDAVSAGPTWNDLFYTSRDGLRLHVRHYAAASVGTAAPHPAILLPGLTRNAADFHVLATAIANDKWNPQPAYAFDYRGRGKSQYDEDWENYTPYTECLDILDFLTAHNIPLVDIVGTSRGGIIAMLMATIRPSVIHSVVLNDIGPVLEPEGLTRIIGYVGKVPLPKTWDEAVSIVREMNEAHFTKLSSRDWENFARCLYNDEDGSPANSYDRNLSKAISGASGNGDMWPQYEALTAKPVLVLRGENSDLLSDEVFREMARRHPLAELHTIANEGHAPLLADSPTIERISQFLVAQHVDK